MTTDSIAQLHAIADYLRGLDNHEDADYLLSLAASLMAENKILKASLVAAEERVAQLEGDLAQAADSLEAQEAVAWNYCPECGGTDHAHLGGEGFFCQDCGQEWFPDLNYTDVVKKNLSKRHPPTGAVPEGWALEEARIRSAVVAGIRVTTGCPDFIGIGGTRLVDAVISEAKAMLAATGDSHHEL